MKRLVYSTVDLESKNGFLFEQGTKAFFLESDVSYLTDKIVRKFINAICDLNGVGDAIRNSALYNEATLKDFKKRISKAVLTKKDTGKIVYYTISGNGFSLNFPEEDFNRDVIILRS